MSLRDGNLKLDRLLDQECAWIHERAKQLPRILLHLHFEGKASFGKSVRQAQRFVTVFEKQMRDHILLKEKVLFPFLETHLPKLECLTRLWRSDHRDILQCSRKIKTLMEKLARVKRNALQAKNMGELRETGTYLIHLLQSSGRRECDCICGTIEKGLRREEKKELLRRIRKWNQLFGSGNGGLL